MHLLVAEDFVVSVGFNKTLQFESFLIGKGEVVVFVGPNGSGKTTLLRTLAGFLPFNEGRLYYMGRPIDTYSPSKLAGLRAVLSQKTNHYIYLTAYQVVSLGRLALKRFTKLDKEDRLIIETLLGYLCIRHLSSALFSQLSGGEQQRVHLARVFAQMWEKKQNRESCLLFLDEPNHFLDSDANALPLEMAREWAESGAGVCMVLHDYEMAQKYADRVIPINNFMPVVAAFAD